MKYFIFALSSYINLRIALFFSLSLSRFLSLLRRLAVFSLVYMKSRKKGKKKETRRIVTYSQPIEENQLMYIDKQLVDFSSFI